MSSADPAHPLATQRRRIVEQPGGRELDGTVSCVLTRFGLRGRRFMPGMHREFQAVVRAARGAHVPGLLHQAFLVENATTCYSLSFWSEDPFFSAAVPRHVDAARNVFDRLTLDPERGPELWSTRWELSAVTNNLNWSGFDLREQLTAEGAAR